MTTTADILWRHRERPAIDGPRVCRHCHEDWPCDAAILATENERLREALTALLEDTHVEHQCSDPECSVFAVLAEAADR